MRKFDFEWISLVILLVIFAISGLGIVGLLVVLAVSGDGSYSVPLSIAFLLFLGSWVLIGAFHER